MTQMSAMRIIRRQRLQDLERLNSVVLRFMVRAASRALRLLTRCRCAWLSCSRTTLACFLQEQGVAIKTFSDKQIAVAQHVLTTNPMQYEIVRVRRAVTQG